MYEQESEINWEYKSNLCTSTYSTRWQKKWENKKKISTSKVQYDSQNQALKKTRFCFWNLNK